MSTPAAAFASGTVGDGISFIGRQLGPYVIHSTPLASGRERAVLLVGHGGSHGRGHQHREGWGPPRAAQETVSGESSGVLSGRNSWDVTPNGERFLVNSGGTVPLITVVADWAAGLSR
jgi:hypothetical protein